MDLDSLSQQLIERFQHGMPLCAEPYREMAQVLGCNEAEVMACLQRLELAGALSRIGPVFEHTRAGASTLAALAVPIERLEQVAARVSQYPEVNHNYAREHHYNLWFVLTGPHRQHLQQILDELEKDTGLTPLDLPMLTAYRIDLGFPLEAGEAPRVAAVEPWRGCVSGGSDTPQTQPRQGSTAATGDFFEVGSLGEQP